MGPVVLNDETKYLLRRGMALRKKHLEILFGFFVSEKTHPKYIRKNAYWLYRGVDPDVEVPKYDYTLFKVGARRIHDFYIQDPKQTVPASVINNFRDGEIRAAFLSGYLKHDMRGYYFSQNERAYLAALKAEEEADN